MLRETLRNVVMGTTQAQAEPADFPPDSDE